MPSWNQIYQNGFGDPKRHFIVDMEVYQNELYVSTNSNQNGTGGKTAKFFKLDQDLKMTDVKLPKTSGYDSIGPMATLDLIFVPGKLSMSLLYVATDDDLSYKIFSTADGINWNMDIMDSPVQSMVSFKGSVYAGLGVENPSIVSSKGSTWIKVEEAIGNNPENKIISMLYSTSGPEGMLYAGTWGNGRADHGAEVWKTDDGINWELDHSFSDPNEWGVTSAVLFNGKMYFGTVNHADGGKVWCRSDEGDWQNVTPKWETSATDIPRRVNSMFVYYNELYIGAGAPYAVLYKSSNGKDWTDDTPCDSNNYLINSLMSYPVYVKHENEPDHTVYPWPWESLFAGTINVNTGAELWRYGDIYTILHPQGTHLPSGIHLPQPSSRYP